MVAAARCAGRVLDVAFNHRRRGDVQKLRGLIEEGRLGRPYYTKAWWLRRTGIPTLGSWFTQSDAGGRRAAGGHRRARARLRALPARQPGGEVRVRVDLRPARHERVRRLAGVDEVGRETATATFDVEDLATVFMRLEDGGTLLLEASWAMHRADGDQFGADALRHRGRRRVVRRRLRAGRLAEALRRRRRARHRASSFRADIGGAHAGGGRRLRRRDPLRRLVGARRQRAPRRSRGSSTRRTESAREQREIAAVRFVVLGAGAIGGVIGGGLHRAGHDVMLIARGARGRRAALARADAADAGRRRDPAGPGRLRRGRARRRRRDPGGQVAGHASPRSTRWRGAT